MSLDVANSNIFFYSLGPDVHAISNNIPQELIYETDNVTYTFNSLEEKQQFVIMHNQEVSGVGFSVSASKPFSIGGTIVADSKRLSRLGMWQTHTVTKYKGVTTGGYGDM